MTGAGRRRKGHDFERQLATEIRRAFPGAVVRRAQQSEQAYEPDVMTEGAGILDCAWIEAQASRSPTPLAKLRQAERDVARVNGKRRLPIAVTHRTGARTSEARMRLSTLLELAGEGAGVLTVECDWSQFLAVLARRAE